MNSTDFVLSIIASILANKVGNSSDITQNQNTEERAKELIQNTETSDVNNTSNKSEKSRFISFDQNKIFEHIPSFEEPIIHFLFESEPSTAYHLPAIILGCIKTKKWHVYKRGRAAAEGVGGGWKNFQDYVRFFKEKNIDCSLWQVEQNLLDELENGLKSWPEISSSKIPLSATELSHLIDRFNEIE